MIAVYYYYIDYTFRGIFVHCRAPFDLAILLLAIMSIMILVLWNENYGDASAKALHSFTDAMNTIRQGMNGLVADNISLKLGDGVIVGMCVAYYVQWF